MSNFGFQFWDAAGSLLYTNQDAGFVILDQIFLDSNSPVAFSKTWMVDPILTDFVLVTYSGAYPHTDSSSLISFFGDYTRTYIDNLAGSDSIVGNHREVIITGDLVIPSVVINSVTRIGHLVAMLYGR